MHFVSPIFHQLGGSLMRGIMRCENRVAAVGLDRRVLEHGFSTDSTDPRLRDLLDYLENLKNYEKIGVPKDAGTDSDDGFDLGRMRRLMRRLGDPQSKFKAVHIAGTKGKGSTAAFLSNILRKEGYSVGCYTSPHIQSITERIALGRKGDLVSSEVLMNLFYKVKRIFDESIELENGSLSHFEVFTALAFTVFAQRNVDIAVIEAGLGGARDATNVLSNREVALSIITTIGEEHLAALGGSLESIAMAKAGIIKHGRPLVIGGPFKPHIESIIRKKASLMGSPVISASDPRIHSVIKGMHQESDGLHQSCDIVINIEKDLKLTIELNDLRLRMIGSHQLQNAVTAACAALCLREQGWRASDDSVRAGLQLTCLLGRSQFLTLKEAELLGLSGGASLLIDGAHTEASAKALVDTIRMTHNGPVALVVAMASDKDHLAFAKQLLLGSKPECVFLLEVSIAGGKSRIASASSLKEVWILAASELGIQISEIGDKEHGKIIYHSSTSHATRKSEFAPILVSASEGESVKESLVAAGELLRLRTGNESGLIVVTGSLHIVSSVIGFLDR